MRQAVQVVFGWIGGLKATLVGVAVNVAPGEEGAGGRPLFVRRMVLSHGGPPYLAPI